MGAQDALLPPIITRIVLRLVPKPHYRVEPQDTLQIQVAETLPNEPKGCAYHATPVTHQRHAEVVRDALASALSWGWR